MEQEEINKAIDVIMEAVNKASQYSEEAAERMRDDKADSAIDSFYKASKYAKGAEVGLKVMEALGLVSDYTTYEECKSIIERQVIYSEEAERIGEQLKEDTFESFDEEPPVHLRKLDIRITEEDMCRIEAGEHAHARSWYEELGDNNGR